MWNWTVQLHLTGRCFSIVNSRILHSRWLDESTVRRNHGYGGLASYMRINFHVIQGSSVVHFQKYSPCKAEKIFINFYLFEVFVYAFNYQKLCLKFQVQVQLGSIWWLGIPDSSVVKNLPAMQRMQALSLGQEDTVEEEMATQSTILVWEIPWTEEPGGLQSIGLQRVRHDLAINHHDHVMLFYLRNSDQCVAF